MEQIKSNRKNYNLTVFNFEQYKKQTNPKGKSLDKFNNTSSSGFNKKGIIKMVKEERRHKNYSPVKTQISYNYRHNVSSPSFDDGNLTSYISKHQAKERSGNLNEFLKKKYREKIENKHWYNNYKSVDSNENSMLAEKNEENIYIPSDKTLLIEKNRKIMFTKTLELKKDFTELSNEGDFYLSNNFFL